MKGVARGNPNWGKQEFPDWRFRVRGKSPDGRMVTLGSYMDEKQARAHCDQLIEEGYYRLLRVHPVTPKPAEPQE